VDSPQGLPKGLTVDDVDSAVATLEIRLTREEGKLAQSGAAGGCCYTKLSPRSGRVQGDFYR
jgi:hypothetical protein